MYVVVVYKHRLRPENYKNPDGSLAIFDDKFEARKKVERLIKAKNDYIWADYKEYCPFPPDHFLNLEMEWKKEKNK